MKKTKLSQFAIIVGLLSLSIFHVNNLPDSSPRFKVFRQSQQYHVINTITHDEVYKNTSASKAIQWAIDQLKLGGDVQLAAGRYKIEQPLKFSSNLHLRGTSQATILQLDDEAPYAILMQNIHKAMVQNLSIMANGKNSSAIVVDNSHGCQISDVNITGFHKYGCYIRGNSFLCKIENSQFHHNTTAIFLENKANSSKNNIHTANSVEQCKIQGGQIGIYSKSTTGINITDCIVGGTRETAIQIESNRVNIKGCQTHNTGNNAIKIRGHKINITGNNLINQKGSGISIDNGTAISITANNITGSGKYGLFFNQGDLITVTGNTIRQAAWGIVESDKSANNVIMGNVISDYKKESIVTGENTMVKNNVIVK